MSSFWIRYLANQPVRIHTHIDTQRAKREFPLLNVSGLIAAYKTAVVPLLDHSLLTQLTLHSISNGVETNYNSWDPLTVLGENGRLGTNPLIIKSLNNAVQRTVHGLTVGMEVDSLLFANKTEVPMTTDNLLSWLCGNNTNSTNDLKDHQVFRQEQINSTSSHMVFPLVGREESLQHIASCFLTSYQQRYNSDQNSRPLPVCTGLPGIGKTRLLVEGATTVMDMTEIPGKRISGIVSFGNDGNAYCKFDELLGIQCSFAWRVLHMFFKAHYYYEEWMREKSPKNRKQMTLDLALSVIERHWSQKTEDNILVFVGIDGCHRLGQEKLNSLLDNLCNSCRCFTGSKLSFFCMLAGTDLNMTRIAGISHPNIKRTPIRFLNHMESIKAIGSFISLTHPGFVVSEVFAQNVFYLGGVPLLLTEFAKEVVKVPVDKLTDNLLEEKRYAALAKLQFSQLSFSDTLKLLAISFTNTPVLKLLDTPFPHSRLGNHFTWTQLVSYGACLVQEDGRVLVPYHLIVQVQNMNFGDFNALNKNEQSLVLSLQDLSNNHERSIHNQPAWLTWESFGAYFYAIRINSFLVLGHDSVPLSSLVDKARFAENEFQTVVCLKIAKVVYSIEQFGPDMPRLITTKGNYHSIDWIESDHIYIVLNGDNGPGVDMFFMLTRAHNPGHVLLLDQRKRQASKLTQSNIASICSKIPAIPGCINGPVDVVFGIMSIHSRICSNVCIPSSTFLLSISQSFSFHGSLFDHPGCSLKINVNTATIAALCQIYGGNGQKRLDLAKQTIQRRETCKFKDLNDLESFVSTINGKLESAEERICF